MKNLDELMAELERAEEVAGSEECNMYDDDAFHDAARKVIAAWKELCQAAADVPPQ